MAEIPMPADLSSLLADYERRLRALETAPKLQNSEFPWPSVNIDTTFSTSSLTPVASSPTAGPIVTATITDTGRCLVTASAYVGLDSTGQTAFVSLFVDGVNTVQILGLSNGTSTIAGNVCSVRQVSNLTPGSHTFELRYYVTTGSANFSSRSLIVQPY